MCMSSNPCLYYRTTVKLSTTKRATTKRAKTTMATTSGIAPNDDADK